MSPQISQAVLNQLSITDRMLNNAEDSVRINILKNQKRMFVVCLTVEQAEEISSNHQVALATSGEYTDHGGKSWLEDRAAGVYGPINGYNDVSRK